MFIAHGEKFRKNARWIMAGVLLLLIPSFVALFTSTSRSERRRNAELPTIGDKPVDVNEFQAARNAVTALRIISTGREPRRTPEVEDRLTQEAVVQMMILRKAKEFGIRVSDNEVLLAIQSQPFVLNEAGQFDPERYRRFTIYLNNLGISELQYEQIIRDEIARVRVEHLVAASAVATPQEINLTYTPLHERLTVELAEFNIADYTEPVSVSNEEAQAYYEQNKESFRTPAQVKVRYADFTVEDAKKTVKLSDEEISEFYERNQTKFAGTNGVAPPLETVKADVRKDLLQLRADRAAADRATDFSIRIVPKSGEKAPDFAAVCAEFGISPIETGFFSQPDKPVGGTNSAAFVQQAFALTPDVRTSDPIAGQDGYCVLEYLDSKPSAIPPFEEVKDKVIDQLKQVRIYDATVRHGQETVAQLKKLVAAGKSFADACAELKLKVQTPPAFAVADENLRLPAAQRIQQEVLGMRVGAVSDFLATLNGGIVFCLKVRQPPDPATAEKDKARWAQRILQQNRQALFQAWVSRLLREQQVSFGRQRSRPVEAAPQPEAEPSPAPSPTTPQS